MKGAIQAIAGGCVMDPLCAGETDSSELNKRKIEYNFKKLNYKKKIFFSTVAIGTASETLNEWADEEAGIEAVQKILDSLDDIHALQDNYIDPDLLRDMLRDNKLHDLLRVRKIFLAPHSLLFFVMFIRLFFPFLLCVSAFCFLFWTLKLFKLSE